MTEKSIRGFSAGTVVLSDCRAGTLPRARESRPGPSPARMQQQPASRGPGIEPSQQRPQHQGLSRLQMFREPYTLR